jgi:diguanylate cyclase (GGDEF)-like protein/PAS domain S-box-containing protein
MFGCCRVTRAFSGSSCGRDTSGGNPIEQTLEFYQSLLDSLYDGIYFMDRDRRILYWNKGAERITGFSAEEVVGTRCWDNVLMHADSEGNPLCRGHCPAEKCMCDGIPGEADVYLHHKEGHRVPVKVKVSPMRNEAGEEIGAVEIFSDNSERLASLQLIDDLREKMYEDFLTGLANRRFMERVISSQVDEMDRFGWTFGLVFIDIDHFKVVNDTHGHDAGDDVLKMVARTLANCSRSFDTVARWGGEEFIATAMNVDREGLLHIAERYRAMVAASHIMVGGETLRVTISLGATLVTGVDTSESLVKRADELMYRSKQTGRNRVTMG